MNQRGFGLNVTLISICIIGLLGAGLWSQISRNGQLKSERDALRASVEWMDKQIKKQDEAQRLALNLKEQAERDAAKARRDLQSLKVKYAELLNSVLPDELYNRLLDAIAEANGDLPASKPDGKLQASLPKG